MNSSKIDITYEQTGRVCVFASYSIIMNYFSSGRKSITDLMDTYISAFSIRPPNNTVWAKETAIHQHYHAHCQANNLRGFQFIADQHKMNTFYASKYCYPVSITMNQWGGAINRWYNGILKRRLKRGGLAMVLMAGGSHTIVVGFDKRKRGYFYRNPQRIENDPLLNREDFLKNNDVFEYIVFERYKKRRLKR